MINKRLLLAALFLFAIETRSQDYFGPAHEKTEMLIGKSRAAGLFPGAAVMVSYNDSIVYSQGFGYADISKQSPIDPLATKFRIASITKIMTSVVITKLVEEGKLDFRVSPHQYLDSLSHHQYMYTIDDLGSHLSGLPRNPTGEKYACPNPYRRRDFYNVYKKDTLSKPGTTFRYSNYGYKLLGLVAEKVSGDSLTALHRKYVIDPLNLHSTEVDNGVYDANTAVFYKKNKEGFELAECLDCSFMYASGCYLSTASDLVRLGNAFLYMNRILSKDQLITLIKARKLPDGQSTGYGFGFNSEKDEFGNYYFGHNGALPGARSALKIYPDSKLVIVLLTNGVVNDLEGAASQIARQYIKAVRNSSKNKD